MQPVGFVAPPPDTPMRMQRIFRDWANVVAISTEPPRNASLYGAVKAERSDARCVIPRDGYGKNHGAVPAPILRIDGDEVGWQQVGITMGVVGIRMIDVVRHPAIEVFVIELDVSVFEGHLPIADFQAVTRQISAIGPGRYQA